MQYLSREPMLEHLSKLLGVLLRLAVGTIVIHVMRHIELTQRHGEAHSVPNISPRAIGFFEPLHACVLPRELRRYKRRNWASEQR